MMTNHSPHDQKTLPSQMIPVPTVLIAAVRQLSRLDRTDVNPIIFLYIFV